MAALQAQTKLSSSEPGVCPPDLRGAASANKTHKDPRHWRWPSPCLPAILPPTPPSKKTDFFLEAALPAAPVFQAESDQHSRLPLKDIDSWDLNSQPLNRN